MDLLDTFANFIFCTFSSACEESGLEKGLTSVAGASLDWLDSIAVIWNDWPQFLSRSQSHRAATVEMTLRLFWRVFAER